MDLKKECFKFNDGPDSLCLCFTPSAAKDIIANLNFKLRMKKEKQDDTPFLARISGTALNIKSEQQKWSTKAPQV